MLKAWEPWSLWKCKDRDREMAWGTVDTKTQRQTEPDRDTDKGSETHTVTNCLFLSLLGNEMSLRGLFSRDNSLCLKKQSYHKESYY